MSSRCWLQLSLTGPQFASGLVLPEMSTSQRSSFKSRPLDAFYFGFFILHLLIALLVDLQHLYPQHVLPDALKRIPHFYIDISHDPLVMGAQGLLGGPMEYAWFNALTICLEG